MYSTLAFCIFLLTLNLCSLFILVPRASCLTKPAEARFKVTQVGKDHLDTAELITALPASCLTPSLKDSTAQSNAI